MSSRLASSLVLTVLASAPALAQEEERVCPEDYRLFMFTDALGRAEQAFGQADFPYAATALDEAYAEIPCLRTPVPRESLARFGRLQAQRYFYAQDEVQSQRWGVLSRQTVPDLPWSDDFPEDHPFRELIESADLPPVGGPESALAPPKKGGILLDGELIFEPRATAEVPHLLQVFDKSGLLVDALWQDGAAFPEAYLDPEGRMPAAPRWAETLGLAPEVPERPKSASSGPNKLRLGIGIGLAAGAAGLYGIALASRGAVGTRETHSQNIAARNLTNSLAISSAVLLTGSVATTVSSLLTDQPGLVSLRVRF